MNLFWNKWAFNHLRKQLKGHRVIFWNMPINGKIRLSVKIDGQWRYFERVWDINPAPPSFAGVPDYSVFALADEICDAIKASETPSVIASDGN